jgi:hypothetical protein
MEPGRQALPATEVTDLAALRRTGRAYAEQILARYRPAAAELSPLQHSPDEGPREHTPPDVQQAVIRVLLEKGYQNATALWKQLLSCSSLMSPEGGAIASELEACPHCRERSISVQAGALAGGTAHVLAECLNCGVVAFGPYRQRARLSTLTRLRVGGQAAIRIELDEAPAGCGALAAAAVLTPFSAKDGPPAVTSALHPAWRRVGPSVDVVLPELHVPASYAPGTYTLTSVLLLDECPWFSRMPVRIAPARPTPADA